MTDVDDFVAAYRAGDDKRWACAEIAYRHVGKRNGKTKELAESILCEVDTIENYAAAWWMWERVQKYAPNFAESIRKDLYLGHFHPVGRKCRAEEMSLDDGINLLVRAQRERLTCKQLRSRLPSIGGREDWMKSARRLKSEVMRELVDAPRLNVDEVGAAKVARAARLLAARIEAME